MVKRVTLSITRIPHRDRLDTWSVVATVYRSPERFWVDPSAGVLEPMKLLENDAESVIPNLDEMIIKLLK